MTFPEQTSIVPTQVLDTAPTPLGPASKITVAFAALNELASLYLLVAGGHQTETLTLGGIAAAVLSVFAGGRYYQAGKRIVHTAAQVTAQLDTELNKPEPVPPTQG